MKRDLLSIKDLSKEDIYRIIERAMKIKAEGRANSQRLKGYTLGLLFEKASTRTRVSFEVAMFRSGGQTIYLNPADTQLSRDETLEDTARVLSRYLDVIAIRTYSQERLEIFSQNSSIPVINALSDKYHPCQVLSDIMTVIEKKGNIESLKIAWIGDGNNVANSWINAACTLGFQLILACPRGYEPEEIRDAKAEGVEFEFLTLPVAFEGNGSLERVKCVRMKLRGFDGSGRRKPVKEEGSEFYIDADLAVICIGQEARLGGFADELRHDGRGKLIVDEDTLQTNIEGVFAGGDVLVPSTVVESVAHGRKAAVMIDRYLGYDGKFNYPERIEVRTSYDESAYERQIPRKQPIVQDVEERLKGFVEVNKGLLVADAIEEAKRCLHCDRGKEIWKGDRDA